MSTASSVLSDIFYISQNTNFNNLGFDVEKLIKFEKYPLKIINRYYLRIKTDDKPGVLSTITNLFTETGISLKKYCNY